MGKGEFSSLSDQVPDRPKRGTIGDRVTVIIPIRAKMADSGTSAIYSPRNRQEKPAEQINF